MRLLVLTAVPVQLVRQPERLDLTGSPPQLIRSSTVLSPPLGCVCAVGGGKLGGQRGGGGGREGGQQFFKTVDERKAKSSAKSTFA